jgi:enoyl-CoA hydratase/carnithine racemase
MSDRVTIQIKDGVADVRLTRPDKMNALDPPMMAGLIEAGKKLGADPGVRVVVLSGEGRAFCAGLDFSSFRRMAGDGAAEGGQGTDMALLSPAGESPANFAQRAAFVWQEVPVPVIAAVHGVAFGGGLQVAMGADIRFVAPDARLSVMEVKWGLIPDMSGTQTLRHLLRLDVLKELTFTGRIVQGPELLELGLATHLSETPLEDALELAREIASKSPSAIRAGKRLLNETVQSSLAAGFAREEEIQRTLIGQPNQVEAVKANLEKRAPDFEDAT